MKVSRVAPLQAKASKVGLILLLGQKSEKPPYIFSSKSLTFRLWINHQVECLLHPSCLLTFSLSAFLSSCFWILDPDLTSAGVPSSYHDYESVVEDRISQGIYFVDIFLIL